MGKLDYKGLAAGLKLSSEKEPDGDEEEGEESGPMSLGARLRKAIAAENDDAIEECIRQIVGK